MNADYPSITRERTAKALHVLVVYDGALARRRVEKILARIASRLPRGQRFDSTFRSPNEVLNSLDRTNVTPTELLVLATECSAALSPEVLSWLAGLLPVLKTNDGALALLTGDMVPRQMDVLMVERLLKVHAERLSVPFIRGHLRGLGCPGSRVSTLHGTPPGSLKTDRNRL